MICPKCGFEMQEGQLYCEHCGMEIQIVPDFEPEIENSISETLNTLAEELTQKEEKEKEEEIQEDDFIGEDAHIFDKLLANRKIFFGGGGYFHDDSIVFFLFEDVTGFIFNFIKIRLAIFYEFPAGILYKSFAVGVSILIGDFSD